MSGASDGGEQSRRGQSSTPSRTEGQSANTGMRERGPTSRAKLWVLMEANRWAVVGLLFLAFALVLTAVGVVFAEALRSAVEDGGPITSLFQALVVSNITGVTLVVTINQVVLSQEQGPVEDQRERMEGAMEFRRDAEEAIGVAVAPSEPAAFLTTLVESCQESGRRFAATLADASGDESVREQAESFVDEVVDGATHVESRLDAAEFGTFDVVSAVLDFEYGRFIYEARKLRYGDEELLTEEAAARLDELIDRLTLFGPAREHFKTLYFQWELINLSRAMLYAALPALVLATSTILYVNVLPSIDGATLGVNHLALVVAGATTLSLLPFLILISFVLRIATVAQRTLAVGPFVLRETQS